MSTTIARIDYETRDLLKAISYIRKTPMIALIREYARSEAERIKKENPRTWETIYGDEAHQPTPAPEA